MSCAHSRFRSSVSVDGAGRREAGGFPFRLASVRIACDDCGLPFAFLGLPAGVNVDGACTTFDGEGAVLAIAPRDEVISEMRPGLGRFIVERPT